MFIKIEWPPAQVTVRIIPMRRVFKFLLALSSLFFFSVVIAAPIPGTTSSLLINPEKKIFFSPLGFKINAQGTPWEHTQVKNNDRSITTLYREPYKPEKEQRALLTVRTDRLKEKISLSRYVRKWLHEYPHYGFDILKTKKIKLNGIKGFLVEVTNKAENKKQIRQVIFLKDKVAVTLSCIDQQNTFKRSLKACNHIIRSFTWTQ